MKGTGKEVKIAYLCNRPTDLHRCAIIGLLRQYDIFFKAEVWNLRSLTL